MVSFLRFLSKALFAAALSSIVIGVGMIIVNGGKWPDSLSTIQNLFKTLHSSFGPLAYIIQIALFAGPGVVVGWVADSLEDRQQRQNSN